MEKLVKLYKQKYCGRVVFVKDYGFLFEELHPKRMEVVKTYWVMESYFFDFDKN